MISGSDLSRSVGLISYPKMLRLAMRPTWPPIQQINKGPFPGKLKPTIEIHYIFSLISGFST
jgi:hypothetical protein